MYVSLCSVLGTIRTVTGMQSTKTDVSDTCKVWHDSCICLVTLCCQVWINFAVIYFYLNKLTSNSREGCESINDNIGSSSIVSRYTQLVWRAWMEVSYGENFPRNNIVTHYKNKYYIRRFYCFRKILSVL